MIACRLALALFLLLPSAPALAQSSWHLAVSGGAVPGFVSGIQPVMGVGIERMSRAGITIGGDFALVFGETGSEPPQRDYTGMLSVTVGLRPLRGRTEPFVALGGTLVGSERGLTIAAGLDQWVNARLGIHVEARGMSLGGEGGTSSLRVGAVLRF